VREFSLPEIVRPDPAANLTEAVFRHAAEDPDGVALVHRVDGQWSPVTMSQFADRVGDVAAGLVASGIGPGDRVALMGATSYEWTLCDYAIWSAGAVTVPVYETSSADQVEWILGDSGCRAVIVQTAEHSATVSAVAQRLPDLEHTWVLEAGAVEDLAGHADTPSRAEAGRRRAALTGADLATLIYTSGTTGRPKGCELTHQNFLVTARNAAITMPDLFRPGASTLLFLPLAHVFGRLVQCGCIESRVRLGLTSDVKNLVVDLIAFQPTFLLTVPRVLEKIYNTAALVARSAPPESSPLPEFEQAVETAIAYSTALQNGRVNPELAARRERYEDLVYAKLRAFLGGKVEYAVSGGAPLGERLGHFFRGAGLTVLEGYGLTETTATGSFNTPQNQRVGTVGRPGPGCTIRIADDGEILLAGPCVFRGYLHDEAATVQALEPDGFFHTGDIGALDDDGYLTITGRKKEIIVTAAGKNVAPAVLEDRLRAHPLISQCLVVGDRRPYIAALITLDEEALPAWKREAGKPDDLPLDKVAADEDLRAVLQAAVDQANLAVSRAESIRRFAVLPVDFTEAGGHLTPSMKIKRAVVLHDFAEQVDELYA
jgi:long-chain acyl-CoA synthetase